MSFKQWAENVNGKKQNKMQSDNTNKDKARVLLLSPEEKLNFVRNSSVFPILKGGQTLAKITNLWLSLFGLDLLNELETTTVPNWISAPS